MISAGEVKNNFKMDAVQERTEEEKVLEERKKKLGKFFNKKNLWVLIGVILLVLLGIYIRSQPMTDHNGHPGLWDITTNTWTLGPDLDPFLFLRYAKIIVETGSLPAVDMMRNAPLGFETLSETMLLPYMIVWIYKAIGVFGSTSVEYAAVIFPVIMFALTILAFFLFVREIFNKGEHSRRKASIIALISTLFMIVIPVFLSRTVAGIPEKESAAFFFMFLAFYLFLKAWKSNSLKKIIAFGVLAGISTAMMGLIWGGVSYIFVTIAVASFIAFLLGNTDMKKISAYSSWIISSWAILMISSAARFPLKDLLISLDTGLASLVLFIFAVHLILEKTGPRIKFLSNSKIPKNILSLIISAILIAIIVSLLLGPGFLINKAKDLNKIFFTPTTGRWVMTVAENRQPYFSEWGANFGPFIQGIPILFWMFFAGSVFLFKNMLKNMRKKDAWILTALYVLFFCGLVFSRYAPHPNTFDGENFISKAFYYGSALLLAAGFIYFHVKYHKRGEKAFEGIDYEIIFLFSLLSLCLFTARSAVRLIMVLGPIAPIFLAYLLVALFSKYRAHHEETGKVLIGALFVVVALLSIYTFWSYYSDVKAAAYSYVPSSYTQQWQKAMEWVRTETPEDSVFAHWWDYGYWVQSMGNRATVVDGGNAIVYWNYLVGRLVLTGDNQKDALEFLYSHNTTHLLIDSTDIGKYTAYSSIGSDENFDRYSYIPTMLSSQSQVQETRNSTILVFQGGSGVDEDIKYFENGSEIFLPGGNAAIIGILIEKKTENEQVLFQQPNAVFAYNNKQYTIPLRYVYYQGNFIDFKSGLEATVFVMQKLTQSGTQLGLDDTGALMYISPRVMRGLFAQKYLLNDPFNRFGNFKLVHSEPSFVKSALAEQGNEVEDFVYFNGVQGPIKVWEIDYAGNEKVNEEYLQSSLPASITWGF